MIPSVIRVSIMIMVGALFCGCGMLRWGGKAKRMAAEKALAEARRAPLALGRVSLVNVGERFALIDANLAQSPPAGTMLRIYSGGAVSAELRATGVRRRPFLVADLVSGMPVKGDLVVQPIGGEVTPPRAVAATLAPAETPSPPAARGWKKWLPFFGRRK